MKNGFQQRHYESHHIHLCLIVDCEEEKLLKVLSSLENKIGYKFPLSKIESQDNNGFEIQTRSKNRGVFHNLKNELVDAVERYSYFAKVRDVQYVDRSVWPRCFSCSRVEELEPTFLEVDEYQLSTIRCADLPLITYQLSVDGELREVYFNLVFVRPQTSEMYQHLFLDHVCKQLLRENIIDASNLKFYIESDCITNIPKVERWLKTSFNQAFDRLLLLDAQL